ncbi:hypothetical protein [Caldovatus aquaticus]|uniref:Uncharacterized protein n=1 Tax=Caldovatus aquaticus TaxID=2865671 RepID=A0ABS7EY58_9PROT|nr:hypothetical protein [Caldovatus aquaticus]MBW8268293.1 hypothetical protein [Caldovatus aquaticus]
MSMRRMFGIKAPRMPAPSQEELQAQQEQRAELERQRRLAAEEEARLAAEREREEQLRAANRVGARSLLSGDWQGFRRGGDLGAA